MATKDVQDKRSPINHLDGATEDALKVGLLGRRQLVVKGNDVDIHSPDELGELLGLAGAHEGLGDGGIEPLSLTGNDDAASRLDEPLELIKRLHHGPIGPSRVHANDERPLRNGRR